MNHPLNQISTYGFEQFQTNETQRDLSGRFGQILTWTLVGILTLTAVYTLSQMTLWQNSIRLLMERAQIALAELKRVGGFDRSTLIVATTTGTGWLDPSAVDPVEYIHAGNIATVTLKISIRSSFQKGQNQ